MSNPFDLDADTTAGAEIGVDNAVVKLLPKGSKITSALGHGGSLWTRSARIDVDLADGTPKSYFIKVGSGENGRSMLQGEYHSAADMTALMPGFSPIPIGWGVFESDPDLSFFLQAFHEMDHEIPDMDKLTKMLAEFHLKSQDQFEEMTAGRGRPEGHFFGYHTRTHNGKLGQDNTWTKTWEEYFVQNMRTMLQYGEDEGGEWPEEIVELLTPLFEKVIPRLLRPMEMEGRSVTPSLLHGDLWFENTCTDLDRNLPIVYDACCFWGHNEYEIRTMRQKTRFRFGKAQQRAYLQHYPAAYPAEDFEPRNALYHLRSQLHDCALFPQNPRYRQTFHEEVKKLVDMFPEGLEGWLADRKDE